MDISVSAQVIVTAPAKPGLKAPLVAISGPPVLASGQAGAAAASSASSTSSILSTARKSTQAVAGATEQSPASVQSTQGRIESLRHEAEIRSLSRRDQSVRNHEAAHASVAGVHGGAPRFQYQRGPDGVLYAVAGSVSIDLSPVAGNPQATLAKARIVQRAALAPADPSAADRAIAAQAAALALQAALEISQQASSDKLPGTIDLMG